jgi:hypothetical protein
LELILTERYFYSIVDGKEVKLCDPNKKVKWEKKDVKAHMVILVNLRLSLVVCARHPKNCGTS